MTSKDENTREVNNKLTICEVHMLKYVHRKIEIMKNIRKRTKLSYCLFHSFESNLDSFKFSAVSNTYPLLI